MRLISAATLVGGLLLSGGASAFDWAAVAPTDSVRACPRHGPGFVEVPGTSSCVRIGGQVRADYGTTSRRLSQRDAARISGSGVRLYVDSRSDTPLGPLRMVWSGTVAAGSTADPSRPGFR